MNYIYITAAFIMAMLLSYFILPRIILISYKKNLFDEIDERKIHTQQIPRLGGVSFPLIVILTLLFINGIRYLYNHNAGDVMTLSTLVEFVFLICGMMLLFMVGIADDLIGVNYRSKFVTQIAAACLFPLSGFYISNLGGLLNIYEIPAYIGMPVTILLIVFITNAINLIDGIDGLASEVTGAALLVVGILFLMQEMWMYAMLSFIIIGLLIPFFYFNVFGDSGRYKKLFMGDTGSLTLGYLVSFLLIHFCTNIPQSGVVADQKLILISFSAMIVPCFDVIRVMLVRIRNKKSPFQPDRNHIHHKFLLIKNSPRQAMVSILLIDLFFIGGNILLTTQINIYLILILDVVCWILLHLWLNIHINQCCNEKKKTNAKHLIQLETTN